MALTIKNFVIESLKTFYEKLSTRFQETLVSGVNLKTVSGETLLGSGNVVIDWKDLSGVPSVFPVETHNHDDRYVKLNGASVMTGDLNLYLGDVDRFVVFSYPGTTNPTSNSWRTGVLGSGSDEANYYVVQYQQINTSSSTWNTAFKIGQSTGNVTFTNNITIGDKVNYHAGNLTIKTLMGTTAIGDADEPVYWNGNSFVKAGAYPTKASWNYDDRYLKLAGGKITGPVTFEMSNDRKIYINNSDDETYWSLISFQQKGTEYGTLGTAGSTDLQWNGHNLYHAGNLTASVISGLGTLSNNISGNAATATNAGYATNAGNADTVDGCHAGFANGSVVIYAPFPSMTTLKNDGYISSSYGTEEYGYPDEEFLQGICKWAIATYSHNGDITLMGAIAPNSSGTCIIHLYSSSGSDPTTNLPRYCRGLYQQLGGNLFQFGTVNYEWSYGQISAGYATTAGSAPASDVYSWAKQPSKPTYSFSEITPGTATIGNGSTPLIFRSDSAWKSGIYHSVPGNESMVFANINPYTSWIFATADPSANADWSTLSPSLQIKHGRVTINKLIANSADASYNLDVNGSANATTLYENGVRVSVNGHTHTKSQITDFPTSLPANGGYADAIASKGVLDSQEKIDNFITPNRFEYALFKTTDANNVDFASNDGMIISIPWASDSYGFQMAFDDTRNGTIKVRGKSNSWGNWYTLLHSGNYTTYTVKKDGTGASGTWDISITGNAKTATTSTYASNVGSSGTAGTNYVTAANVISMYNWYNSITATDEASNTAIDKWNEIVSFLAGITDTSTLSGILAGYAAVGHNHDGRYVKKAGDTMTGLLTTTSGGNHKGIKVGDTYINAIGSDLILQNNGTIRFGGDSWDYNVWAGLKYVHSSKTIYLGLADGSAFTANSAQSGGKLYLSGIDNLYTGNGTNLVWHAGNDGSGSGLDADLLDGKHSTYFWNYKIPSKSSGYWDVNEVLGDTIAAWAYRFADSTSVINGPVGNNVSDARAYYTLGGIYCPLQLSWYYTNSASLYARTYYNGSWYSWKKIAFMEDITWSNVASKPETATRWPSWSEVTNKPSTFPVSEHNHDGRYLRWNGSAADISAMAWGTLTAANGYTILSHAASSDGGDWGMVNKSGKIYMQLDGYYYQNEGQYRVTDVSETVTALGTSGDYLTWTKNGTTNNITVPYASNADTVDDYHVSDNYNLLYKNVTNLTCTPSSITTDYWYVKILIQSSYQNITNQKMYLIASYSNFMTKAELQVYGYFLGYKYTASSYNADTITGIASTRQGASQVIWLRMKKPTQYEGVTPNGNISIYSNYIASAEVITSAPSDVIFTDTLQSDGQHILSGDIKATSFKKNGSSDNYVLLGGGGHKAISEFKIGDYLPLAGGWMDWKAQIYFKGINGSTSIYSKIGYDTSASGNKMHCINNAGHQVDGALYITSNGSTAANDTGGLAIDNEGVTVFGAGDPGSNFTGIFRVLNEDNVADGPQFLVTKASGSYSKYGFIKNGYNNDYVLLAGGGTKAISDFAVTSTLSNYVLKKPDTRFYNYIGCSYHSNWYKVTFPFHNTTSTNNRWMMVSMELILKGNYLNGADGTVYLSYYIYYPANNNVGIADKVYAVAIGSNMNNVRIAYNKADLGIFYVYVPNNYNSFAIQNLSANDTAQVYDFTTTTIDALTSATYPVDSEIQDINIRKLYTTDGTSLMLNGNVLIDAGNISSQSVNYATSAENADTLDNYHENDFFRYRGQLYQKNDYDANTLGIGEYIFRSSSYSGVGTGAEHVNALNENSTIQVFKCLQMSAAAWSDSMSYRLRWGDETNAQRPNGWSPWIAFISSSNYTEYTVKKDGTGATGTWKINVTGSAGSVERATFGDGSNATHDANAMTSNGLYYYSSNGPTINAHNFATNDAAMYVQAYNSSWVSQIAQDYRSGKLAVRSRNNGTWQPWRRIAFADSDYVVSADRIYYEPEHRKFTRTASGNSWDTQAYSVCGYKECRVTYKISQTSAYIMVGLNSDPTTDASYQSIDYCWYTDGGGSLSIYENGSYISSISGHTTYTVGDEFIVEYSCGQVRYYHNGVLCRTVVRTYGSPLYFDCSFYNVGSIENVVFEPIHDSLDFVQTTASYSLSNASWVNTITLPTTAGSYILNIVSGNSTLTGVFSIGASDNAKDEISLHLHGNGPRLYARTNGTTLQLSSNDASATSRSVTIKYRRMI